MNIRSAVLALSAAACLVLPTQSANAATTSGTAFTVQVTVTAGCNISTDVSGPVDFGSAPGTGPAPADVNRTVGMTCTNGTGYSVYFTSSNAMTGTNRFMVNGGESIGYQILHSGSPVGNTAGTGITGLTGTGAAQTYPLVFNINDWSAVTPQIYTDTVTMQVDF